MRPTSSDLLRLVLSTAFACMLSIRGARRRSLSKSGSVAAFIVGFLSMASSYRFGITLYSFYYFSTKATRFRSSLKAEIEDGFESSGGNRSVSQVLASSGPAVAAAVTCTYLYRSDDIISSSTDGATFILSQSWLNLFYMLFFAACAGDTFSSEFGVVLGGPAAAKPVLITSFGRRTVPRGTNGGVTLSGTLASACGGFIIGLTYFVMSPQWTLSQLLIVPLGMFGGLVGSLLDSLLGSWFQLSVYDPSIGKVLKCAAQPGTAQKSGTYRICGSDLLSGESVNAIAAVLTGLCATFVLQLFPSLEN